MSDIFGLGQMFDTMMDTGLAVWQQDKNEGMTEHAMNFSRNAADKQRDWQTMMASTAHQRAVNDLRAAGLNPMLAINHGGSQGGGGAMASTPGVTPAPGARSHVAQTAALLARNDAEVKNIQAATDRTRAEEQEIIARTPVHAQTIEKMQQDIKESVERAEKLRQDVKTGIASAALFEQQARNLQETIPQIRAHTNQLHSLARLNDAQARQALANAGLSEAETQQVLQRLRQDLPALERALKDLERVAMLMQQPGHAADEAARSSFIGQVGAYLKALLPIQGIFGSIPLSRLGPATSPRTPTTPPMIGTPGQRPR